MNLFAMDAELAARGFQYIDTARRRMYLNEARARVDNMYLWPYREASAVGLAPLYLEDLGVIEAVTDTVNGRQLQPIDYRTVIDETWNLGQSGTPIYFYVGQPDNSPVVATYPVGASDVGVQYYRRTPDLVADDDAPLMPAEYHLMLVDMAAQRAYINTDNMGAAQALQPFIDQNLATMVTDLMGGRQIAGPQQQGAVYESFDTGIWA